MKQNINQVKNGVASFKVIILFIFSLFYFQGYSFEDQITIPTTDNGPIELSVSVHINNLFNVNTVDESYQIDGYLMISWIDERLKFDHKTPTGTIIYENDQLDDLTQNGIWFPSCELINIQGTRQTHNRSLEIQPNGKVVYDERFNGTFGSDMYYKKFPFDTQRFKVVVEPFSYDTRYLVLTNLKLYPEIEESSRLLDKWDIKKMNARIENIEYEELEDLYNHPIYYSRAVFEIEAKRLSGFFVWQVLFPLFIIIMASFVVFWIKDFSNQIGIGFTLMLTVVAFNFYSVTILPKLPYNTFIETIIIAGYLFIFLSIIAIIVNSLLQSKLKKLNLLKLFRVIFPLFYLTTMVILSYLFFGN